jgi:hypothetical protein
LIFGVGAFMFSQFIDITVQNIDISISTENNANYICLTDMVKGQEGEDHIRNWMRNHNTLEFLGAWEMLHNPTFIHFIPTLSVILSFQKLMLNMREHTPTQMKPIC